MPNASPHQPPGSRRGPSRPLRARRRSPSAVGVVAVAVGLAVVAVGPAPARGEAQTRAAPSITGKVALAPLAVLGARARSSATRRTETALAAALGDVPGVDLIAGRRVRDAVRKARKPALADCDSDVACLADLGALLGCRYVVFAEVGGVGDAFLVYLKLVDVSRRAEVRSTTMEQSADTASRGRSRAAARKRDRAAARAAAVRLLAPARYTGRLRVVVDIDGASIYVDGRRLATSPAAPIELPVGAHALRITHPEFRDYIRFVDVAFDDEARVDAGLLQLPVVGSDWQRDGSATGGGPAGDAAPNAATPWYRRWYAVAGLGAVVLVGSAIVVGVLADGVDADRERVVGAPAALRGVTLRW